MKNKIYEIQYDQLGKTLWVHCSTGETVGRFDIVFGIDIHTTIDEQLEGKPQCLHCTHSKPSKEDLDLFVKKAKELWDVEVDVKRLKI